MREESISLQLCDKFHKYYENYELLKKEGDENFSHLSPFEDNNEDYLLYKENLENLYRDTCYIITELYNQSIEDNFYFLDCPLIVYKNTYRERLQNFLKYHVDADEVDFLKKEIETIINPTEYDREIFPYSYSNFFYSNDLNFKISKDKKIEFIKNKLLNLGIECEQLPDEYVPNNFNGDVIVPGGLKFTKIVIQNEIENPTIDISSKKSKQLTSNQIVLLFDKIGFFTHPNIENIPKIKQAKLLSLLTGLNEKNLNTNISKLDNSPKSNGEKYLKDIDFIDLLFSDLTL